ERQVRANECGLMCTFEQFIVTGTNLGPQFINERVIPLFLCLREVFVRRIRLELGAVEFGLWIFLAEQGLSHPVKRDEVVCLARSFNNFQRCWQAPALVMTFGLLNSARAVERIR